MNKSSLSKAGNFASYQEGFFTGFVPVCPSHVLEIANPIFFAL